MGKLILTTRGVMDEDALERSELEEDLPCGRSKTTTWRLGGEVVKQDVEIVADKMPPLGGGIGAMK